MRWMIAVVWCFFVLCFLHCSTTPSVSEPLVEFSMDSSAVVEEESRVVDSSETMEKMGDSRSVDSSTDQEPLACNGSTLLCDRKFNDVVYATTHNAMSNSEDGWFPPNQSKPILQQLRDGIRGLMLDTYLYQNEAYLCHANCDVGKKKLVEALGEIREFLETHRNEVVTLILESRLSAEETRRAFESSRLLSLTYVQVEGKPWSTLRAMIEQNRRVVVLTDREGGTYPWYHDMWSMAWDTRWQNSSTQEFSCKRDRGKEKNALWILNHFLGNPLPSLKLAKEANSNPFFLQRVVQCQKEAGQLPNFITVDFYELGDLFAVVRTLNQLE